MLSDDVWKILLRLGPAWKKYLCEAGLDLRGSSAETLANDLTKKVDINFELKGLEDFCRSARNGIEPGDPAKSLLYHVLASPGVTPEGIPDESYPRPHELDTVENFVFSLARPSMDDLRR